MAASLHSDVKKRVAEEPEVNFPHEGDYDFYYDLDNDIFCDREMTKPERPSGEADMVKQDFQNDGTMEQFPHPQEDVPLGADDVDVDVGLPTKSLSNFSLTKILDEWRYESREAFLEAEMERLNNEIRAFKETRAPRTGPDWQRQLSKEHSNFGSAGSSEPDNDDLEHMIKEASESEASEASGQYMHDMQISSDANLDVIKGSALAYKSGVLQIIIYTIAFAGLVFVMLAKAYDLQLWASSGSGSGSGSGSSSSSSSSSSADGDHRRLGGEASIVIINTGFMVVSAGVVAFIMHTLKQPLVLGYILGGMLVGPLGLDIVDSYESIKEMSKLGLILLLFMTGLEMDCGHLFSMGRSVVVSGTFQFPVCAAVMTSIFVGLQALGVSFGSGPYSALYCGATCAVSSTMIVVKWLTIEHDMDSVPGRLTMGILHFQDCWVMFMLAYQPHLTNPEIVDLIRTSVSVGLLIAICIKYAKYVMPAVMMMSKGSVELMMEEDLTWCFLIGCFATLPFINLSFELAALVAGVALATFPFSADVSGKVKYIEDFFITLFFGGLGMQLTIPTMSEVGAAMIIVVVVLLVRWIGLFPFIDYFDGGPRLATVVTLNLSQISELALVICSLGVARGHVEHDTLTILILAFAILAIMSGTMIGYNYQIYGFLSRRWHFFIGSVRKAGGHTIDHHTDDGDHADRNIVLLGFHKVSALLLAHFEHYSPAMLGKIHVIDYHEHIMAELRKRGVTCAYGDISSPDVLAHAHHEDVRLVISSVSDVLLRGVTNLQLLQNAKKVWPHADVIVTATTQEEANILYQNGADYVIRMTKLCAERLHDLITDHSTHAVHHQHVNEETKLSHVFAHYKKTERNIPIDNGLIRRVSFTIA